MSKPIPYLNEVVSLTVMLLMIVALVAAQTQARAHDAVPAAQPSVIDDPAETPFRATIKADINGTPLTISIDASAELDLFRLEDE